MRGLGEHDGAMKATLGALCLLGLLYGCSGGGFLPYAPQSLNSLQISQLVGRASLDSGAPMGLVRAVLMAESDGDPNAISMAGAQGLMQLMPGTASHCGVDAFDPQANVECGATYLKALLDRYHGDATLAVAAYNAGPGAVAKYHGVPPYPETRAYVARVIAAYRGF
jgi:soluble lytic murein transglycosylase-like protein